MSMTTFHPDTPQKCRPPKNTIPSNGIYFRVVFNNPPTPKDFVIWVNEPENRRHLEDKKKRKDCGAFAISMLSEEGVIRSSGLFRRQMRKRATRKNATFLGWAQVELESSSGVIKQTGRNPHHHDLWPYMNSKLECNVVSVKEL